MMQTRTRSSVSGHCRQFLSDWVQFVNSLLKLVNEESDSVWTICHTEITEKNPSPDKALKEDSASNTSNPSKTRPDTFSLSFLFLFVWQKQPRKLSHFLLDPPTASSRSSSHRRSIPLPVKQYVQKLLTLYRPQRVSLLLPQRIRASVRAPIV